jgi:hypothetical protein
MNWEEPTTNFSHIDSSRSPCTSSEYDQDQNQCRDTNQGSAGYWRLCTDYTRLQPILILFDFELHGTLSLL